MHQHNDVLSELNKDISLSNKIKFVHTFINKKYAFIDRIAIALYESRTDMLRTYVDSTHGYSPLHHYEARLSDTPSLFHIVESGQPRVINDLEKHASSNKTHTQNIITHGYQASYTMPIFDNGMFIGFIFIDSCKKNCFRSNVLSFLDMIGHLVSITVAHEIFAIEAMAATLHTASDINHSNDTKSGVYLDRMAHYSKMIAEGIAVQHQLSDEFIQNLFTYAPLHDIGKIGIPDALLLKPGKLNHAEYEIMKQHVESGRGIIDAMLANIGAENFKHIDMLRNIVEYHHEAIDGTGYVCGLAGNEIPIEARIVAVADVFNALTSYRTYKEIWNNTRSFAKLRQLAGTKLDSDCVEAFCNNPTRVEEIQQRYSDQDKET